MRESEIKIMLLIILRILLPTNVVDSALVKFPTNTAVTVATYRTKFRCKSDEGYELKWFIQANNTAQRQVLAFGNDIRNDQAKSYCSIENEEGGEFNLILSIQDESAQTYTCHEPDTNQERSAELIKMEPTKFEKDASESHVTLTCSVKFRGNWAPELELSHNGASVVDGAEVFVAPNQHVSTTLVIPRNDRALAGNYSCTTRFNLRGKPQRTTDNSVPSYVDTSTLTVHVEEKDRDIPADGNSKDSSNTITIVCIVVGVGVAFGAAGIVAIKMRKSMQRSCLVIASPVRDRERSSRKSERSSTWEEEDSPDWPRTTRNRATAVPPSYSEIETAMFSNGVVRISAMTSRPAKLSMDQFSEPKPNPATSQPSPIQPINFSKIWTHPNPTQPIPTKRFRYK